MPVSGYGSDAGFGLCWLVYVPMPALFVLLACYCARLVIVPRPVIVLMLVIVAEACF